MKKKIAALLMLTLSVGALAGCLDTKTTSSSQPSSSASSGDASTPKAVEGGVVLKLGHFSNEMHPIHTSALQFAENVAKRTNGEVTIEIYPNNELGSPMELLEQTTLGTIDFTTATLSDMGRYSKKFYAVQTPFIFSDYDHAHNTLDSEEFIEWAKTDLDEQNMTRLSMWEYGFRNTTTNGIVVNTPADLKGVKIRVPKVAQLEECFAALGAVTEKIDYNELYLAMKQGVADGQENPISVIYADKLYEVQNQLAITNHMYESVIFMANTKAWDKLTEEQQQIIQEESDSAAALCRETIINSENDTIAKLEELGMSVTRPNLDEFRGMMEPAYKNIAGVSGQENFDTIIKMAEDNK